MTNLAVIENKISAVKKYLRILEKYKKYSRKEIEDNLDIKGYEKINYDIVYKILQERLKDIEDFLKRISGHL